MLIYELGGLHVIALTLSIAVAVYQRFFGFVIVFDAPAERRRIFQNPDSNWDNKACGDKAVLGDSTFRWRSALDKPPRGVGEVDGLDDYVHVSWYHPVRVIQWEGGVCLLRHAEVEWTNHPRAWRRSEVWYGNHTSRSKILRATLAYHRPRMDTWCARLFAVPYKQESSPHSSRAPLHHMNAYHHTGKQPHMPTT